MDVGSGCATARGWFIVRVKLGYRSGSGALRVVELRGKSAGNLQQALDRILPIT